MYNIYILTQFTILLAYLSASDLQSFQSFSNRIKPFLYKKKTLSQQFWISTLVCIRFMVFYGGSSTLSVTILSDRLIISNNKTINGVRVLPQIHMLLLLLAYKMDNFLNQRKRFVSAQFCFVKTF